MLPGRWAFSFSSGNQIGKRAGERSPARFFVWSCSLAVAMADACEVVETLKENFVAGEVAFGEVADDIEGGIPGERGKGF